ncbi:MAG TPA: hypothetical protein VJB87_01000, partial [Candidatus Nanoarchaeia archaeon]|nr:hypothetical protein [Candidatus Nanoarchaeia archaeon]
MKTIRGYGCVSKKEGRTIIYGANPEGMPMPFPTGSIDALCTHTKLEELQQLLGERKITVDHLVLLQLTIAIQEKDEMVLATRKRFVILNGEKPFGDEGISFQWFGPHTTRGQSYDEEKRLEENGLTPFEIGETWPFPKIRKA